MNAQDDEAVKLQLSNMGLVDLQQELLTRGISIEKIISSGCAQGSPTGAPQNPLLLKQQTIHLLRQMLHYEALAIKANLPLTWKISRKPSTVQFFSEVVMVSWDGELLFCGPFFPSPRDRPVTIVVGMNIQTHVWRTIQTQGKPPNPFLVFKRMPIYFIEDAKLYLAFSDQESGRYVVSYLDLKAWTWHELEVTGLLPPPRDYVDGCCYKGFLIISGNSSNNSTADNVIHRLNLTTCVWSLVTKNGDFPTTPNGSSLRYQNNLIVFSKDSDAIFMLQLDQMVWEKSLLTKLPDFNARRHSHLIQIYKDKLYLIRICDGFQLNCFDMISKEWKVIDTIGKRPNKVRTEASFLIDSGVLYSLGGQSGKNHLLLLSLEDFGPPQTKKGTEWLQDLWEQDNKDITFKFPNGSSLSAHKFILSARNLYFKAMFTSSLSKQDTEIQIHDVDFKLFEACILYLYDLLDLEKLVVEDVDFGSLFLVADKFLLVDLQILVADYLTRNLDPSSSINALRLLSNVHSTNFPTTFKKKVMDFMCLNAKEIAAQPMFLEICREETELARELFAAMGSDEPISKKMKFSPDEIDSEKISPNTEFWFTVQDK